MHIFNAGGSARWGPVPFMKKRPEAYLEPFFSGRASYSAAFFSTAAVKSDSVRSSGSTVTSPCWL